MRKTPIALLIAAAAWTTSAQAQGSQVELYGIVDGFVQVVDTGNDTVTNLGSGGRRSSRFGLRGSESLGSGLSAIYQLEAGFLLDNGRSSPNGPAGDGMMFERTAMVGLKGGFGELKLGRQYIPHFIAMAMVDPTDMTLGSAMNYFGPALGGDNARNQLLVNRNNTVIYGTPSLAGFSGMFAVSLGEHNAEPSDLGDVYNAMLTYAQGAALLNLSYTQQKTFDTLGNTDKYFTLTGAYDFGFIKPSFMYVKRTASEEGRFATSPDVAGQLFAIDAEAYQLGATVPAWGGNFAITAGVLSNNTVDEADAFAWGLRYEYPLSKQVHLYGGVTGINNDAKVYYSISGGGGSSPAPGADDPVGNDLLGKNTKAAYLGMSYHF